MAEKLNRKFQNYVQKDGVIKEVVSMYKKLEDRGQWNYYDLNKMCLEVALNEGISENEYRNLIRDTKTENKSDFINWKLTTRKDCPKTTAGWRHQPGNHNLELYGPLYKSPKLTMVPLYEPVNVIFLG
ncbi:uncharacterized protein [Atheta coriaria]|uniref:uncharacterized protein isoform X2 n=1 Tax=Dalotia coriaria TaxID=877792 RepID=UPI0031F364FB